jgi:hypothetical protein
MKRLFSFYALRGLLVAILLSGLQSCIYINTNDNITPRGVQTRDIALINFDQLAMGSAFKIHVKQGSSFRIQATGELNDLDDLEAIVNRAGVLEIRYRNTWRGNRDRMDIDITMPTLRAVDFSGASVSTIEGFPNMRNLDIALSGASKATYYGSIERLGVDLSGASQLDLSGAGTYLTGDLSGASQLYAFDYPVNEADLGLSGASRARLTVNNLLKVDASGGSNVRYKGTPTLDRQLSGGSTVTKE